MLARQQAELRCILVAIQGLKGPLSVYALRVKPIHVFHQAPC